MRSNIENFLTKLLHHNIKKIRLWDGLSYNLTIECTYVKVLVILEKEIGILFFSHRAIKLATSCRRHSHT